MLRKLCRSGTLKNFRPTIRLISRMVPGVIHSYLIISHPVTFMAAASYFVDLGFLLPPWSGWKLYVWLNIYTIFKSISKNIIWLWLWLLTLPDCNERLSSFTAHAEKVCCCYAGPKQKNSDGMESRWKFCRGKLWIKRC